MKAIRVYRFGEPEVMQFEDVPPLTAGPGQILLEVKAAGVNPVDTYIRAGIYGAKAMPYTPGLDAAGLVQQVGPGVEAVTAGQRVFTAGSVSGTYAQQCLCDAAQVHPLPDNISFSQGAAVGIPYGTAYRGLSQRGHALAGQTVLIHGASGGVGLAAIQLAKAAGLNIIATAGTEEGRQLLKEQGAGRVLDHYDPEHFNRTLDFTGGAGVDLLLEMLANVNLGEDLKIMADHGQVVVIGSRGTVEIDPRLTMAREVTVTGLMLAKATPAEKSQMYQAVIKGLQDGSLNPVVDEEFSLSEAPQAHHRIMESGHHGKIVLVP